VGCCQERRGEERAHGWCRRGNVWWVPSLDALWIRVCGHDMLSSKAAYAERRRFSSMSSNVFDCMRRYCSCTACCTCQGEDVPCEQGRERVSV
jgi:hypothetical protein